MLKVIQSGSEPTRRGFVTNYPDFRHWRREAAEEGLLNRPLNIYLHLPYCIQRCAYCHYKTTTLRETQLKQIDRYVDALCREIELGVRRFHLTERPVISIYFGGGTPSLLNAKNVGRIMHTLRNNLTLADPEINVEAEPVSLTERKAEILKGHGVNRLNIGIQSFCDDILFRTGRKDTEKQALNAIKIALATGAVVNIDLISGLQGETSDTWAYSVGRAVETAVPSITVYKLEVYANTEYYADLRRQKLSLPEDDVEITFASHALDEFCRAGYEPVNFFTFTKGSQYVQRHTTTKWQGTDVCAFGVSAFGSLGNWAYQNTADIDRYTEIVESGLLPIYRGYVYNDLELMIRDIILGMKLTRLDRAAFKARHGIDMLQLCDVAVRELQEQEFIAVDERSIAMTRKGILYGDHVGRRLAAAAESVAGGTRLM